MEKGAKREGKAGISIERAAGSVFVEEEFFAARQKCFQFFDGDGEVFALGGGDGSCGGM